MCLRYISANINHNNEKFNKCRIIPIQDTYKLLQVKTNKIYLQELLQVQVQVTTLIIISQLIVTTMNNVTETLKRNMVERHSQPPNYPKPNSRAPSTKKQDILDQKFMQHFQTINKTNNYSNQEPSHQDQPITYQRVMIDYSSKSSHIDSILSYDEDAIHLAYSQLRFAVPPVVPILKKKANSLQAVNTIYEIFAGKEQKENIMGESNSLMVIEYYSQILKDMGRKEKVKEVKPKQRELSKSPTYQKIQAKEVQTSSRNATDSKNSEQNESKMFQKTSRKDLILMELIREKKRKNFAPDYFAIMEMKLMELLEFILEDQASYMWLDPHTKVREVLKNLEQFQSKMIEGQSKINLLRIFFQEFTNLKRQKDQIQSMKAYTPMKGLENRDKTPPATSGKFRTTKETFKESRKTNKETTPLRKSTKNKKEGTINWIQHQKNQGKASKARRSPNKGDVWIGS